jgi:low affinity Fe/Cu permease
MERVTKPSMAARILGWIVGLALILLGLFVLTVASFADGTATERAITIATAVAMVVLGVVILRLVRVGTIVND